MLLIVYSVSACWSGNAGKTKSKVLHLGRDCRKMELCPKFATQIRSNQIGSVQDGAGDSGVDGSCCPTKQSTAATEETAVGKHTHLITA